MVMRNVIIRDSFTASFIINRLIVVVVFGIARNYVPFISLDHRLGGRVALKKAHHA